MRKNFLPFSKPSISEDDIEAVGDVLRSGWITTGPQCVLFEEEFCKYTGCKGAVALSSATAGMHLVLHALGIGPGDEVITPSMTWVSTVNLIVLCGAKPAFVDIDRDTLMTTPDKIRKKITKRTKLIIPVHFAGAVCDLDGIRAIGDQFHIPIVEDAAHAIGSEYKGERIGKKGTSIFSFHPIKNITCGEGGMFCSDNSELIQRIKQLKFHGLGVDAFDRKTLGRTPQAEVLEPGFKYNLPDTAAVLGLRQLQRIAAFNARRERLANVYLERIQEIDELKPLANTWKYEAKHAWHLFVVRLDLEKTKLNRDEFMHILKQKNIGTGLHFKAVHQQKYYRENMAVQEGELPNTEYNSKRILSLPLFPGMTMDDLDDVVQTIKETLYEYKK